MPSSRALRPPYAQCLDGWMAARKTDGGCDSTAPPCPMCRSQITGWHESEAGERGAGDAPLDGVLHGKGTSARLTIVV